MPKVPSRLFLAAIDRMNAYLAAEGHANPPSDHVTDDGYRLGAWAMRQRFALRQGTVEDALLPYLAPFLPWWTDAALIAQTRRRRGRTPQPTCNAAMCNDALFDSRLVMLRRFAAEHGHASPTRSYVDPATGFALGTWVVHQRGVARRGRMTGARHAALSALPGWIWDEDGGSVLRHAQFERRLAALDAHVARTGALPAWLSRPPTAPQPREAAAPPSATEASLAHWLDRQIAALRRLERGEPLAGDASETLLRRLADRPAVAERLASMKASGGTLDPRWLATAERVRLHMEARTAGISSGTGPLIIPTNLTASDGLRIGEWVRKQRERHALGLLSAAQIAHLEAIPRWTWLSLREARRAAAQTPTAAPTEMQEITEHWRRCYERCRDRAATMGTAHVRHDHVEPDGLRLGRWQSDQRRQRNAGRLSAEKRDLLEALKGWTWDHAVGQRSRGDTVWRQRYERLRSIAEKTGRPSLPAKHVEPDGIPLGRWLRHQRMAHRNGTLRVDHAALLAALPGWRW